MTGEQVPCKVCGQPAPRFGPYAGYCEDHRAVATSGKPNASSNGSDERILKGELDEARDILRRLVMNDNEELDELRLEAARHLIGTAL